MKFVSKINAQAEEVYAWHQKFGANERLTPPWVTSKLLRQEFNQDEILQYVKTNSGIQVEKTIANPTSRSITSETIRSAQQSVQHIKNFDKFENNTLINETIKVNWFTSILPEFIVDSLIEKKLEKEFHFRGKRIENDLKQHAKFASMPRQNIAILGENDEISSQFKPFFTSGGHTVFSFVKRKPYPTAREIQLNTQNGNVGFEKLQNLNSIIFFPLDDKVKINEQNFDSILENKRDELKLLISSIKSCGKAPESFIMMSNTCVYKQTGLSSTEISPIEVENKMALFFTTLEKDLEELRLLGTRVIYARTGNILTARTGILKRVINRQKFGLCRQLVDYDKFLNWISLDDAIYATNFMILNPKVFGAVNLCSSMAINANDLSVMLTEKTRRPILFSLPKFIFNLFYSNIKQDQILQRNSVFPDRLKQFGYDFSFENIDDTLNWETGNFYKKNTTNIF